MKYRERFARSSVESAQLHPDWDLPLIQTVCPWDVLQEEDYVAADEELSSMQSPSQPGRGGDAKDVRSMHANHSAVPMHRRNHTILL